MSQLDQTGAGAVTAGRWPTRDEAWQIMTEYVQSQSLRRHMLAVEAAMRAYARRFGEDEERWASVALLHDFDYEIHPTLDHHPQDGAPILRARGISEDFIHTILTHADHLELERATPMEKALWAVDEVTGFAAAVALVRPDKRIASVTPSSFKKKMKDKAFARGVSREDMLRGAEQLGVPFDEHVQIVIDAMAGMADELGLAGQPVESRQGGA